MWENKNVIFFLIKKACDFIKVDNRKNLLLLVTFWSIYRENDLFQKDCYD